MAPISRRSLTAALLLATGLGVWFLTPFGTVASQQITQVLVTNWPSVFKVEGEVTVKTPIRLAKLVKFEDVLVAPVRPSETTRLIEAGTLETEGFPSVVLSLHGVVKGDVGRQGEVGVILLPDQPSIQQAFDEQGLVHFALRAEAQGVSSLTPYFASNQPDYNIGFQAYRVLLYNTTDKAVTANVFAYLTN
jgi:hypothetical protein